MFKKAKIVLGKQDIHIQKNSIGLLSYTPHRIYSEFKVKPQMAKLEIVL